MKKLFLPLLLALPVSVGGQSYPAVTYPTRSYPSNIPVVYPPLFSCTYSIDTSSATYDFSGGTGQINVTVGAGCAWTAVSNDAFITVTGGASGTGNGTVDYSVAAVDGAGRSGTITVAGKTFTTTQTSSLLNGLVAYWPLSEASGNRVDVIGSKALAPAGTVSTTTGPGGGTAVLFTGVASSRLSSTDAIFNLGDTTYTWAYLVKLTDKVADYWAIGKEGASLEYTSSFLNASNRINMRVWSTTTNKDAPANNYGVVPRGFWLRVIGWHNSTADTVNVRVGGEAATSTAMGNPARAAGASPFYVGSRSFDDAIGKLAVAHLGLWNRTLTTAEQTAIQARVYPFGASDTVNIPAYPDLYVAFGDSKTADDTWQKSLVAQVDGITTGKIATSGATTAVMAGTIVADLAAFIPTTRPVPVVMYELGTNDLPGVKAATLTEAAWGANFETITQAMHVKWPSAIIYLNRPWQRDHTAAAATYAGWLATKIAAHPTYLAAGPDEAVWLENGDNGVTYTDDGIHPNTAGKPVETTQWKTVTGH